MSVYVVAIYLVVRIYNGWKNGYIRVFNIIFAQAVGAIITNMGAYVMIILLTKHLENAEQDGKERLSQKDDDRITKVGHFIRATRLDEIPQFFNILKGDMSLVGPRPERPAIAAKYEEAIPEFAYRLKVKAGLTGYAQVYGKYNTTAYDKLKLDLMYIQNYRISLDIEILMKTIQVIFTSDAAEGVDDGFEDALKSSN